MHGEKDKAALGLIEEMFEIQQKANAFMNTLTHDKELPENLVLLLLRLKLSGFLKITEIAEAFRLTPGAVTNMCDKLEHLELIERVRIKEDRRVVRVTLTKGGEKRVEEIFKAFSPDQLNSMSRSLAKISRLFEEMNEAL